jgi:chemotaxis protein CheD
VFIKNQGSAEEQIVLNPGDHFVTDKKLVISTLLGSCVSACLYDPVHHIMGMNHFLLSSKVYQKTESIITSDAGRYGLHAMEIVINGMLQLGAERKYLKAKAFGGGSVLAIGNQLNNYFDVGEANILFIKSFLKSENISLVASDLGGNTGRVIRFDGSDYAVFVRKIRQTDSASFATRDKEYLEKQVKEQRQKSTHIELW